STSTASETICSCYVTILFSSLIGRSPTSGAAFFFSSRRRHTRSVSAFLLNRSSDLIANILKLAAERPLKDIRDEYNYPKKKGIKDECSRLLEASTMKSRRGDRKSVV